MTDGLNSILSLTFNSKALAPTLVTHFLLSVSHLGKASCHVKQLALWRWEVYIHIKDQGLLLTNLYLEKNSPAPVQPSKEQSHRQHLTRTPTLRKFIFVVLKLISFRITSYAAVENIQR